MLKQLKDIFLMLAFKGEAFMGFVGTVVKNTFCASVRNACMFSDNRVLQLMFMRCGTNGNTSCIGETQSVESRDIFRDEQGVTTVGMAIAIFLSMAIMFSGIQTYRTLSSAADIQDVADACALAAQNEVADFYAIANTCDAVVLTMTLASGLSYGLGVVSACVPTLNSLSVKFVDLGSRLSESRDNFASRVKLGLEKYQTLLPYLASVKALSVAKANNSGSLGANYFALSIIVPQSGSDISINVSDLLNQAGNDIAENRDELARLAQKADEAAQAANEAKQRAFDLDCGLFPNRCMYERANGLSFISSVDNPLYSNVDTWNFEVGIRRARAYYEARLNEQAPDNSSVLEQAKNVLNKRFYQYAITELNSAYANETDTEFEYYIPHLYKNNEEFRLTDLYRERIYPVTESDGQKVMHAWSGCPNANGSTEMGAPLDLDEGDFAKCNLCEFELVSISQVASATTNVPTGFEYHYERFRQAADDYKKAKDEAKPAIESTKSIANLLLESLKEIFSNASSARISVDPPGANGCVVIVVNNATTVVNAGIKDVFVSGDTTLGARIAVSAAALAVDDAEDGSTVIDEILDGFELGDVANGADRAILGAWSSLLRVYTGGQEKLKSALSDSLGGIQTNTVSGIGSWASSRLASVVDAAGLQPADIVIRKSVLVNSARVAGSQNAGFGVTFMKMKRTALKASSADGSLFSSLLEASGIEGWISDAGLFFDVANIELPIGGGVSLPISIVLPQEATNGLQSLYEEAKEALGRHFNSVIGGQAWQ